MQHLQETTHLTTQARRPGNRRADETQTHTHTHHPARNGGVQAGQTHKCTHTPTPQPGVAGHSQNPSPTHTPTPHNAARNGGVQGVRAQKHTHAPTPQPGVAGRGCNPGPSTHTRTVPPARRCRGPGGTSTQIHTRPNTSPKSGRRSGNPSPSTPAHTAHPSRDERGTGGARTQPCAPRNSNQEWWGSFLCLFCAPFFGATAVSGVLTFPALGALGLGPLPCVCFRAPPPPPPSPVLCPRCLRCSLLPGPGCRGPWRCDPPLWLFLFLSGVFFSCVLFLGLSLLCLPVVFLCRRFSLLGRA